MKANISLNLELDTLSIVAKLVKAVEDGVIVNVTDEGRAVYFDDQTPDNPLIETQDEPEEIQDEPVEIQEESFPVSPVKSYTIEELREFTVKFIKGAPENKAKVKAILAEFGVSKLPELDQSKYKDYVDRIVQEVF